MRAVTLEELNHAYLRALLSSLMFWTGLVVYVLGVVMLKYLAVSFPLGGTAMLAGVLIMLNADWRGRRHVVKQLRWIK